MTYLTYNINYLIYIYIYKKKTYLLIRVFNKALYRVIILPPYVPGPPPFLGGIAISPFLKVLCVA